MNLNPRNQSDSRTAGQSDGPAVHLFTQGFFRSVLLMFLAFACLAPRAQASVFMRLGRGAQALEQLGGTLLYNTDVRINGQPGKLSAYGFESSPASLAPDLRKALPLPELGGAASMATHIGNGQATTLLLLPGAGSGSSVAILIEQSADAYRKTRASPAEWPGNLIYPGAKPFFSAENIQTHTALAVGETLDSPEAASRRMDLILTGNGWSRMLPQATTPGLTLYVHGGRICLFSATASDDPNDKTRITVLQRLGTSLQR